MLFETLSAQIVRMRVTLAVGLFAFAVGQSAHAADTPCRQLYYFISFSMPTHLIKQYLVDADNYGGTLVLRGVTKDQDLKTFILTHLAPLLMHPPHKASIIIDPTLFLRYQVKVVPTLVCLRQHQALTLAGGVTTRWALEMFRHVSEEAQHQSS